MPAAIRGCKGNAGTALNQAILYFSGFVYNALHNHAGTHCLSSILVIDIGTFSNSSFSFNRWLMTYVDSCLGFYGCLWTGTRIRVDPLTPMFDLTTHLKDDLRRDIASSLDAFLAAVKSLEKRYQAIDAQARAQSHNDTEQEFSSLRDDEYPYVTSYEDEGNRITFSYNQRLDKTKLLFHASTNQLNDHFSHKNIPRLLIVTWQVSIMRQSFENVVNSMVSGL